MRPVNWPRAIPYLLIHLLALGAIFFPFTSTCAWVFALTYCLKTISVSIGFHRYFSHRSFRVSRLTQMLLALFGCFAMQNGPLWWAAHHRVHHRHADHPEDPHSPYLYGFWYSQVLWIFAHRNYREQEVRDLVNYPELRWLDRYNFVPPLVLGLVIYLLWGLPAFSWGFAVSTVACWHASSAINSLGHTFGRTPHPTGDRSRNNAILALFTFGDGWHNNHHRYMNSARHGFLWWQYDPSYWILKSLAGVGIVKDLIPVPEELRRPKVHSAIADNP